jgi:hypothetical protein
MPFNRVDDNTVTDDQGNSYFMPVGTPGVDPGPSPLPTQDPSQDMSALFSPGFLDSQGAAPEPAPVNPYEGQVTAQPQAKPDFQVDPGQFGSDLRPKPLPTAAQQTQARNSLLTNDPAQFAANGGQVKTSEDMARVLGGHAQHEMEAFQAKQQAEAISGAAQLEKMKADAGLINDTADQFDKTVQGIRADSEKRWGDWKKRNDEAAKSLVDPSHAFADGGTASQINWRLMFAGGALVGNLPEVMNSMSKMVDQDIAAQKASMENKREGLTAEERMLVEQDKTGKDAIENWQFSRNLRYQAILKQIDIKIAQIGAPAAQKAGLLAARAAAEKELVAGDQHIYDKFQTEAQEKVKMSHEAYMARLQSQLRMNEDLFKKKLSAGEEKGDTLPTGTGLGLNATDLATGQPFTGQIHLKVKGEKAVEAGQLLSQANEEASQLRSVQKMIGGLTSLQLKRGGTPEFKSAVKDLIQTRAVRDNGHRLSDADVDRAAQEEFGVVMKDSLSANEIDAARMVGPYREGLLKTIDNQLRNLSTKTTNKLQPYISSEDAQRYHFQYNPQETSVPAPGSAPDDLNTAITKAAGGADVSDLTVPGPRPPVTSDVPSFAKDELSQYQAERTAGRGVANGLPSLDPKQEEVVNQAVASFSKASPDDIIRLAAGYLRRPGVSEESKHEIRLEAQEAMADAVTREQAAVSAAAERFESVRAPGPGSRFSGKNTAHAYEQDGQPSVDFQKYLNSGVLDEMRKRAGLEPRKR